MDKDRYTCFISIAESADAIARETLHYSTNN